MRTEKSLQNLKYSFIGQVAGILIALISRMFFVKWLSATYLGINGLFSNILTILSFVELGIGPALTFSLYEPLKNNNKEKIKTLMAFFKKCYIIIGVIILILGLILTPFLDVLIKDLPNIKNLNIIYWLFILNTSVSYFWSYKKTLLTCDQCGYIVSKFHYSFYFLMNVVQIITLALTHNFILYLIVQVLSTIIEGITVSKYVDKKYSYILEKNVAKMDDETSKSIKKNVGAMLIHKFGSIIVTATDNIILSKYVGIIAVGVYSNYYLIINNAHKILKQLFHSIIASVGNLGAEGNREKLKKIFEHINFINYYLQSFCAIMMLILFQDFIKLWVGKEYLFSYSIVIVLVTCFYFTGLRSSVLLFKEALGLYWQDRYKAFFEALINLVTSIILAKYLGVIGVFLGTLISTLTTCFWIEPFVLYKHGFKDKVGSYFIKTLYRTIVSVTIFAVATYICQFFKFSLIINLILKFLVGFILINVVYYLLYRKTDDYKYIVNLIKNKIYKRK